MLPQLHFYTLFSLMKCYKSVNQLTFCHLHHIFSPFNIYIIINLVTVYQIVFLLGTYSLLTSFFRSGVFLCFFLFVCLFFSRGEQEQTFFQPRQKKEKKKQKVKLYQLSVHPLTSRIGVYILHVFPNPSETNSSKSEF